jgi:hypothetical protein
VTDPAELAQQAPWLGGGFGTTPSQEAQSMPATMTDPRTGIVEPVPARPVLTVPAPAATAMAPSRSWSDIPPPPPAPAHRDLQWTQNGEPVGGARRRERDDTAAMGASRDSYAGPTERPAAIVVPEPGTDTRRRGRAIGIIIQDANGAPVQQVRPPVVEYQAAPVGSAYPVDPDGR